VVGDPADGQVAAPGIARGRAAAAPACSNLEIDILLRT